MDRPVWHVRPCVDIPKLDILHETRVERHKRAKLRFVVPRRLIDQPIAPLHKHQFRPVRGKRHAQCVCKQDRRSFTSPFGLKRLPECTNNPYRMRVLRSEAVVVGLLVYVLFSRAGPFGVFGLLFTPTAMIIAQIIIITPLIASIAHQAIRDLWADYHDLLISMNTPQRTRIITLIWDARRSLLTASLAGFGRAIGEVGAIMIVGGNIDQVTRVLTTAIALETGKGNFALALGLGFILITLSVLVNLIIHSIAKTERAGRW